MLLEQSRTRLQRDFEQWLQLMLRQQPSAPAQTAQEVLDSSRYAARQATTCSKLAAMCVLQTARPELAVCRNVQVSKTQLADMQINSAAQTPSSTSIHPLSSSSASPDRFTVSGILACLYLAALF